MTIFRLEIIKIIITSNLSIINSITLKTQAVNDSQVNTKAYVELFHQENERTRRNLGTYSKKELNDLVKNFQENNFNNIKLTNLQSVISKRSLLINEEVSNKNMLMMN